jgi:hypothetical protein
MISRTRALLTIGALSLLALPEAQSATVDVFGGYTLTPVKPADDFGRTALDGWNTSVTLYPHPWLGISGDLAGFYGAARPANAAGGGSSAETSAPPVRVRMYSFTAGPQIRLFRSRRLESSFKALFGGARGQAPSISDGPDQAAFAALFGANFDVNLSRRLAVRFSPGLSVTPFGNNQTQHSFRFSIGPVFRFGGED